MIKNFILGFTATVLLIYYSTTLCHDIFIQMQGVIVKANVVKKETSYQFIKYIYYGFNADGVQFKSRKSLPFLDIDNIPDKIEVIYNPSNPEKSLIYTFITRHYVIIILQMLMIILLVFAFWQPVQSDRINS